MPSSTFKGRYSFCADCKHRVIVAVNILDPTLGSKFNCKFSHKQIRGSSGVKFERDFKICGLLEPINPNIGCKYYSVGVLQGSAIEEWTFTDDVYDKRRIALGLLFWSKEEAEDYLAYMLKYNNKK